MIDTFPLRWRHNGRDSVSNHQIHLCLLNRLFRRRSKKTSKLRITGLCVGNSPGPVNSPHKWPITRKMFPFDDVIMPPCDIDNAKCYIIRRIWSQTKCAAWLLKIGNISFNTYIDAVAFHSTLEYWYEHLLAKIKNYSWELPFLSHYIVGLSDYAVWGRWHSFKRNYSCFITWQPEQIGRHFAHNIFKCIILHKNDCLLI